MQDLPKDVIFVWVPKCAGESVSTTLQELGGRRLVSLEDIQSFDNDGIVTFYHAHIETIKNNGFISEEYYNRAFKFGIVRNPWDRHVSLYFWLLCHSPKETRSLSFKKFCDPDIMDIVSRDDSQPTQIQQLRKTLPQSTWLYNYDRTRCLVDYIARAENLKETLYDKFGLAIGYKNTTKHAHYSAYYTKETRDAVGKYYEEDIDRFGYTFSE